MKEKSRAGSRFRSSAGSRGRFRKPFGFKKRVCRFCADHMDYIDFKNVNLLRSFLTERGKIVAGRATGVCSTHQRALTCALKRARNIALLPFRVV